LRATAIVLAIVLGLVAGVFTTFLFWVGAANISFEPVKGDNGLSLVRHMLHLYAIWLLVLLVPGVVKRAAIRTSSVLLFVFVFLAVVPLPSIWILFVWWKSCLGHPACSGL
jgi:hypothetical protein